MTPWLPPSEGPPIAGWLELVGVRSTLIWGVTVPVATDKQFVVVRKEELVHGARFVTTEDASTIFSVSESASPGLRWEKLVELSKTLRFVLYVPISDSAKNNGRYKLYMLNLQATQNEENRTNLIPGQIGQLDINCFGHIRHNITEKTFDELIPNLHASAFTAHRTDVNCKILVALKHVVRTDLKDRGGFHPGQPPPKEHGAHNERIVALTLMRTRFTRGRTEVESPWNDEELDAIGRSLLLIVTGAWWHACLQHWCLDATCPCGGDLEKCILLMVAVLEAAIFSGLGQSVPACNRWYTHEPQTVCQTLGCCCTGALIHGGKI